MTVELKSLDGISKLLFAIPLKPLQGGRFQPTGFPSLGAATFQTKDGVSLLVESAQSMANRLEAVCWDEPNDKPHNTLEGLSYVRVERKGKYLTSSITEAHRLNSPYLLVGSDKSFFNKVKDELGVLADGPIDRKLLTQVLMKYDAGCLLHGVFLAKKELAGGRLRIARSLSAFIEAEGVKAAVSGGVKNDHINPSGITKDGFGNVPFTREEFTADKITLWVNLDLAQIRGYGLGSEAEKMLILLGLWKLRTFIEGDMRLRTACYLEPISLKIEASKPNGFLLPEAKNIEAELKNAISACKAKMTVTTVKFDDEYRKGKDSDTGSEGDEKINDSGDEE